MDIEAPRKRTLPLLKAWPGVLARCLSLLTKTCWAEAGAASQVARTKQRIYVTMMVASAVSASGMSTAQVLSVVGDGLSDSQRRLDLLDQGPGSKKFSLC